VGFADLNNDQQMLQFGRATCPRNAIWPGLGEGGGSLRGSFKFNSNHFPIQDFYLVQVAKCSDGTEIAKKMFSELRRQLRRASNQLHPLEARMPLLSDDDVVVHGNAERARDGDDLLRHLDVGARRRRVAGGVIVQVPPALCITLNRRRLSRVQL
jgi:hypothetical protein